MSFTSRIDELVARAQEDRVRIASIGRERKRAYTANRRAAHAGLQGIVSKRDVEVLFRNQKGRCFYCADVLDHGWNLDHKTPLSRGGANVIDNLCCTCKSCNASKRAHTAEEFQARFLQKEASA